MQRRSIFRNFPRWGVASLLSLVLIVLGGCDGQGGMQETDSAESLSGSTTDTTWMSVETPTEKTLYDVVYTTEGAYAVGGGGLLLERTDNGWEKVFDGGPTGNGNDLYGADVTDDGTRIWLVGASGAIGEYNVKTGNLNDYSAPNDVTNNFNDVAATADSGDANVYVAGDSGKMYYSLDNGETWDLVTPGSGSAINAVDVFDDRKGHIVDGNKAVFETGDGTSWSKIGIADANVNFYGVDTDGFDDVWIAGGGGIIYDWNGTKWTATDTGDAGLRGIDVATDDSDGLAAGSGGTVYDLTDDTWTEQSTPTGQNLKGVVRGDPDIAVGASGTILER